MRWDRVYRTNLDQVGPNMAKLGQLGQVSFCYPRGASTLIFKIRTCSVRSGGTEKEAKATENALFLRSVIDIKDRIFQTRVLACLGKSTFDQLGPSWSSTLSHSVLESALINA